MFKRQALPATPSTGHRSLVASAARISLDGAGWNRYRFGDESWQQEAWRLYDVIGELRFAVNWVGSCCSRVRIYAADVDSNGRLQQETKNAKVAAIAEGLFGSEAGKAEAMRMLGINLSVAGDAFVVGRGSGDNDEWFVLSNSELKRVSQRGGDPAYGFVDANGRLLPGAENRLDPSSDIVIRIWTPHPRRNLWSDSPTRGAMPILWEIEKLTRYVFAQIDSRLVSAGVLWIPKEASFPGTDGEQTGAVALTDHLVEIGSLALKGEGTAAGVVPVIVELPADTLGKIQLTQFTSELSQQARELREEALGRFATAMDMPPEILKGTGDTNHWSSWHVEESAVKVHIEPLMARICHGLNIGYFRAALEDLGLDPDRFVLTYDTAPLTVRPQKLQDTLNLYDKNVVSREAVILAGDYKLTDMPSEEEDQKRFVQELMLRDPNLINSPTIREIVGLPIDMQPAPNPQQGAGPPPPPAPPTGINPTAPPPLPEGSTAEGAPTEVATPAPVTAAATIPQWMSTIVVADAVTHRAMELAGKRLLTSSNRGQHLGVKPEHLHTRIKVTGVDHAQRILHGAFTMLPDLATHLHAEVDPNALRNVLETYCIHLLLSGTRHDLSLLGGRLKENGLVDDAA
jgi:hypothetical protein